MKMIKLTGIHRNIYASSSGTFGGGLLIYEAINITTDTAERVKLLVKYTPKNYGKITFIEEGENIKQLNGRAHAKYYQRGYFDRAKAHIEKLTEQLKTLEGKDFESIKQMKTTIKQIADAVKG